MTAEKRDKPLFPPHRPGELERLIIDRIETAGEVRMFVESEMLGSRHPEVHSAAVRILAIMNRLL